MTKELLCRNFGFKSPSGYWNNNETLFGVFTRTHCSF